MTDPVLPPADILVVDDNPINLRVLSAILKKQGHQVRAAATGKLALASAKALPPDLILLDIMMPELDGYQVCEQLKADSLTNGIPVIFLSALDEPEDKVRAFAVGGVDYITKPFHQQEVIARIENQLRLGRLQRQLSEQNLQLQLEVRERAAAELKLQNFSAHLKQLHRLNTTAYDSFEDLAEDYLGTGCQIFGLTTGILSYVTGDRYRIQAIHSSASELAPGHVFVLRERPCRSVIQSGQTVVQKNYIGTPVWVDGQIYGSLSFESEESEPELELDGANGQDDDLQKDLRPRQVEIIELMARSLGKILTQTRIAQERAAAEENTQLLLLVTQAISRAPDFEAALEIALEHLVQASGWSCGEAWIPNAFGTALESSLAWYNPPEASGRLDGTNLLSRQIFDDLEEFHLESLDLLWQPNEDLAGRIWVGGEPEYIADLSRVEPEVFSRSSLARDCGLKSALGVPAITTSSSLPPKGGKLEGGLLSQTSLVQAVLVFYLAESVQVEASLRSPFMEPSRPYTEERLAELASAVAAQLGQVIQKKLAEAELRNVFAAIDDLITIYDRSGRLLKFATTKSNFLIKPPAELLHKTLHEVLPEAEADRQLAAIDQALEQERTQTLEYTLRIRNQTRWFSASISPLSENTVIFVAREITESKQIQEQLLESQARFKAIFETASLGICVTNLEGKIMEINPAFVQLLGYSQAELQSLCLEDLTEREAVNREANLWQELLLNQRSSYQLEKRYVRANGELIWGNLTVCAVKKEDELSFIFALIEDITARKQAEGALQQKVATEHLLSQIGRAFLDQELDEAIAWTLEAIARHTQVECCYLLRYVEDKSSQGMSRLERTHVWSIAEEQALLPESSYQWLSLPLLEGKNIEISQVEQLGKEGEIEKRILSQGGIRSLLQVPMLHLDRVVGCIGLETREQVKFWSVEDVNLLRFVGELVAISKARTDAELALQESEVRYRTLYNNTPALLHSTDRNLKLISVSDYWLEFMGYARAEVLGRREIEFMTDISRRYALETVLPTFLKTGTVKDVSYQFVKKNGQVVDVLLSAIAEYNSTEQIVKTLVVLVDITERKRAEVALRLAQQKSESLLLNILPRSIAEQLKQNVGSIAEQYNDVTILFADIVGFTPLSAKMSPIELVNLLNRVFSTFDHLVEKHGLEKIKTIGDAYMVVGGLPVPNAQHAESIAAMALAMQEAIANFSQENHPLQIRIGINTGSVVAGVIGIKKFIYDLWGDTVNIASRMESQGLPGKIQVTDQTYQRLKKDYLFEKRGTISVKGKGRMTTYWLVGKKQLIVDSII